MTGLGFLAPEPSGFIKGPTPIRHQIYYNRYTESLVRVLFYSPLSKAVAIEYIGNISCPTTIALSQFRKQFYFVF